MLEENEQLLYQLLAEVIILPTLNTWALYHHSLSLCLVCVFTFQFEENTKSMDLAEESKSNHLMAYLQSHAVAELAAKAHTDGPEASPRGSSVSQLPHIPGTPDRGSGSRNARRGLRVDTQAN